MANKGRGIFLVYVDIDAKHDQEFNDWYNTEHLPELVAVPGIPVGRYKVVKGGPNIWRSMSWKTSGAARAWSRTHLPSFWLARRSRRHEERSGAWGALCSPSWAIILNA